MYLLRNYISLCKYRLQDCFTSSKYAFSSTVCLTLYSTPIVWAEPLKKKKRMDPMLLKAREDRKKRRIEKEMRKLAKIALQLKPIDENEILLELKNTMEQRLRSEPELSDEEIFNHHRIEKEWCFYRSVQLQEDIMMMQRVLKSRKTALKELRAESEDLYQEAIQCDLFLLPFKCKGPSTTPPIKGYDPVDGDVIDTTRNWNLL